MVDTQETGRHIRRAIPSCVVAAVRDKFLDPAGNYVGVREVDDDGGSYPCLLYTSDAADE